MPELFFKGKEFVFNHHLAVPFRPLVPDPKRSIGASGENGRLDGNLIIHGDNLHALKALLPLYAGKVDCIFIDPPYNTGNEGWCYNDNVNSPMMREWLDSNPVGIEDGLRHDKWLAMMWPRLRLLNELLSETGVLIITIDDNELHRLRALVEEIFTEDNVLAVLVWQKSKKGDAKLIATVHEYVLIAAKSKQSLLSQGAWRTEKEGAAEVLDKYQEVRRQDSTDHDAIAQAMRDWYNSLNKDDPRRGHKHYNCSDSRGLYFPADFAGPDDGRASRPRYDILHPLTGKPCKKPSTGWRWDEDRTKRALAASPPLIHFGPDESTIPCRKSYLKDVSQEPFTSVFYRDGRAGTLDLETIVGAGQLEFPKNTDIVERLIDLVADRDALVLDSFAGSGTTAQAVLQLNHRDGGNRRFILVECENYADTLTTERVRRIVRGYDFHGTQRDELHRERLTFTSLKKANKLLDHVESIKHLEGHRFDRIKAEVKDGELIVTGEREVTRKTEGLGGEFTYCTLGPAVEMDKLLTGENLPAFDQLGALLFHMATNQARPISPEPEEVAGCGYLGASSAQHVWLIYRPDLNCLKSRDAALTLSRAKAIAEAKPDKPHLVYAPARFVSKRVLEDAGLPCEVAFAPLPFALYRVEKPQ